MHQLVWLSERGGNFFNLLQKEEVPRKGGLPQKRGVSKPGGNYAHEHQLNKDFANLCEWFIDNKLSIHLGEDKTKCILFGSTHKLKNAGKLNIMYNGIEIKQYSKVTYLGCLLDEKMSGESMALKTIKLNK